MTTELTTTNSMNQIAEAADHAAAAGIFAQHHAKTGPNTQRAQLADLALFSAYLSAVGACAPSAASLYDAPITWQGTSWGIVAGFVRWMQQNAYSASSTARALATVKKHAKLAAAAGAIDTTQLALIATVTAPKGKAAKQVDAQRSAAGLNTRRSTKRATTTPITDEQRRKLLEDHPDTPQGRRDAVIMALLIEHGFRVSEIADLQVTAVDLAGGRITFYRRKVDMTQTHAFTPASRRALTRWMQNDALAIGPLLRGSRKNGRLTARGMGTRSIAVRVAELAARAGIDERVSPHDLRHDWATSAANGGTDAFALRDAGGWSSLAMPSRYVAASAVANERVTLRR